MSDEARVTYLQEKIQDARRNQIIAYVVTFVLLLPSGLVFGSLGGVMGVPLALWENISFFLGGVILVTGLGIGSYFRSKRKKLMKQLEELAGFKSKGV